MSGKILHLFEGYGIELEYMIVNRESLEVMPITDEVIRDVTGEYISDAEMDKMEWSNELVLHVIELKTAGPAPSLEPLPELFHSNVLHVNRILDRWNARLMPGAMHPWMDPMKDMKLWPHDNSPVYDAYNKIFDCRGHGWANLQSMHINLPFADDGEFGRLHAAIRMLLPMLPALAAASPVADGKISGYHDLRLEVYRKNQSKIPFIAGKVIPERVFSRKAYEEEIFAPLYRDIAPYDPDEILQDEWLNSRGAIARFGRNTIEIRVIDVQECPTADLSIAAFIVAILKAMVSDKWCVQERQRDFSEEELLQLMLGTIKEGEHSIITHLAFLQSFGITKPQCTAREFWKHLFNEMTFDSELFWAPAIRTILEEGTLSTRLLRALNGDDSRENLKKVYSQLCDCLAQDKMFH
jgi:carboxylate-amine ligase